MLARSTTVWYLGIAGLIASLALTMAILRGPSAPRGPIPKAAPREQRLIGTSDGRKGIAIYRVSNDGDRDLVISQARTTCGCSVASIEPKVVRPGGSATVTVEASPPQAGEKRVEIVIETNARPADELVLSLILVGNTPPPFVVSSSEAVQFGELASVPEPESIRIQTRELAGKQPWLGDVVSSTPAVDVDLTDLAEIPLDGGVVARQYTFEVRLTKLPEPGPLSEVISFQDHEAPGPSVFQLPVLGNVPPPLYASPKVLYATCERGSVPPDLRVTIRSKDGLARGNAPVIDEAAPFVVEVEATADTFARYRIRFSQPIEQSYETTLRFRPSSGSAEPIEVPVSLRVSE
jgi:hypothetical protein